jgi:tRNA-2-methylthio-N6-dimethylallyladenosine synthase
VRFHLMTFGCQMNVNDSAWLSRALRGLGLEEVPAFGDPAEADVVIVNTCSVRDKPEQKVYSLLGRLRPIFEKNPRAFAAVGGCVAQQVGEAFWNRFPFVRLVFGSDGVAMAPQAVMRLLDEPGLRLSLLDFSEQYPERDAALHVGDAAGNWRGQAFVNIMQGCDNFCAYCIVPFTRGRQKSRAAGAVLDECRGLVERGVREITLLGQNVNSYGLDAHGDGTTFATLLRRVAALPGLARLRFTTSHPKDIAPEVVDAFGELENLCPHLHLPLQSGSDRMLRAMGRKYDTARYLDIVERLRAARPDMALGTDLIVGFPGETADDFAATLEIMERVRFAGSFSFMYSDRPGTRAERMQGKLPLEVKAERLARLQELQQRHTREDLAAMVGREQTVLLEGENTSRERAPSWRGRDPYNHVVNVVQPATNGAAPAPGALVRVRIREAKKHSLMGERTE